jgi:hypothetical protein
MRASTTGSRYETFLRTVGTTISNHGVDGNDDDDSYDDDDDDAGPLPGGEDDDDDDDGEKEDALGRNPDERRPGSPAAFSELALGDAASSCSSSLGLSEESLARGSLVIDDDPSPEMELKGWPRGTRSDESAPIGSDKLPLPTGRAGWCRTRSLAANRLRPRETTDIPPSMT